jgi:hypothetical protein
MASNGNKWINQILVANYAESRCLLSAHNHAPPPTNSPPTIAALECHRARHSTIEVPRASHRTSSLLSWSRNLLNPAALDLPEFLAASRTPQPSLARPIISPRQHIAQIDAALSSPLHAASAAIYLYGKRGPRKGEWTSSGCSTSDLLCCASDASCVVGTSSPKQW